MTTTLRQSDGTLSLDKTELGIANFEAGFAEFLKNEILLIDGKKINRITFETLNLVQPAEFKLTLNSVDSLSGFSKIWSGAMFVKGSNKAVIAWRKDS